MFVKHISRGNMALDTNVFIVRYFFFLNQQSEYKVIYELMCWLSGSLTCGLPNVMRSPPARRSLVSSITVD